MTEPTPRDEILTGRDEATPVRALNRVFLVILVVFIVICGVAYGLYTAFS